MSVAVAATSPQKSTYSPSSSCLKFHTTLLVISVALFIFSTVFVFYFERGGLGSLVSCCFTGAGAWLTIGVALSSCVFLKTKNIGQGEDIEAIKKPQENEPVLIASVKGLQKQEPPITPSKDPNVRKFKKLKREFEKSKLNITKIERRYTNDLEPFPIYLSQESSLGDLQERLSFHFLSSLWDPLLAFFNCAMKALPIGQKISQLNWHLKNQKLKDFTFLVSEEHCKNNLQETLFFLYQNLAQICAGNVPCSSLRITIFRRIKECSASSFYREKLAHFASLPKEEALKVYPEIALFHAFVFEWMTAATFPYFLHDLSKTSSLSYKQPFSLFAWKTIYKGERREAKEKQEIVMTTSFFFHAPASESSDVFALYDIFLAACRTKKLKCAFFSGSKPVSACDNEVAFSFYFEINPAFLEQSGEFENKKWGNAKTFLEGFLEYFKLMPSWIEDNFPLKQIAQSVHKLFFGSRPNLRREERQIFQILVLARITEKILLEKRINLFFFEGLNEKNLTLMATLYALSLLYRTKPIDSFEENRTRFLADLPVLSGSENVNTELLKKILLFLSSLKKGEREGIQKTGIQASRFEFKDIETLLAYRPNQTVDRLPSELRSEEEYEKALKLEIEAKRTLTFTLYGFVANYFKAEEEDAKFLDEQIKQFESEDFDRNQYMIDYKKIEIPGFSLALRKAFSSNPALKIEYPKTPFELIQQVCQLEKSMLDPISFIAKLRGLGIKENFKTAIKECYFSERAKAIRMKAHELANRGSQKLALILLKKNERKEKEILALSHQGVLSEVSYFLQERYKLLIEPKSELEIERGFELTQREPKFRANTCFNYTLIDGQPVIEIYQIFEIIKFSTIREARYYFKTQTTINLKTGNATIQCSHPLVEDPGDITEIVKQSQKKL